MLIMCLKIHFFSWNLIIFSQLIRADCFFFLVFFKSKFYFFLNSRVKNGLNNYIFHATKCISRIQLTVIHWFIGINGENDCAQKGSYCKSAMCRITFKTILKSRSHSEWHTLSSPNISVYTLHSYIK